MVVSDVFFAADTSVQANIFDAFLIIIIVTAGERIRFDMVFALEASEASGAVASLSRIVSARSAVGAKQIFVVLITNRS